MDVDQVRQSFLMADQLGSRIRAFCDERMGMISRGAGSASLEPGATTVVHLMPASIGSQFQVDLVRHRAMLEARPPSMSGSIMHHFNADGFLNYISTSLPNNATRSSYQTFRNGAIEYCCVHVPSRIERPTLNLADFERGMIDNIGHCLGLMARMGVAPPYFLILSFMNFRFVKAIHTDVDEFNSIRFERHTQIMPDVRIDDPSLEPTRLLRPLFDQVWQCFGRPQSANYNEAGEYQPR
jgi:hypothetical protein